MPYERTRQIEQRFQQIIKLIAQNSLNAKELAASLGISTATIYRIITELRKRGYNIRSVRDTKGWCYELISSTQLRDNGDEI
jgi:biotin operon repressor